jgi:uncharacterized protein Yka (UPF0111/DUF47 family)
MLLREEIKSKDCELKTVTELSRSQQAEIDHMRRQREESAELLQHIISQVKEVEAESDGLRTQPQRVSAKRLPSSF